MLAVQGPQARSILAGLADGELPARFRTAEIEVAGAPALVCGTGYTGEDGVEILVAPEHAVGLWDALLAAGVAPAGLGARDTLRLEVGYCLYGNELSAERSPIEAGLGWCCKEETGFIGSEIVAQRRADGPGEKLVAFALTEKGVPRQGNPLLLEGAPVGEVTSGTHSPSLENGVGLAYVAAPHADPGTDLDVDIRGKLRPARIETSPLFKGGSA
jgi:glycine cleavage system T protein (aminomethyltransferase)